MKKNFWLTFAVLAIVLLILILTAPQGQAPTSGPANTAGTTGTFKNASFTIEDRNVTLTDGVAEIPAAPGSASIITTRYFGNEAVGDLNGDGMPDAAFLVTQDRGGSGTFFYVVAALATARGFKTTNAFFIGDRIAPQSTEIANEKLQVNFAERRPGEPMTAPPTQGTTLFLKVTPQGTLAALAK